MSSLRALNSLVDRLGHASKHISVLILGVKINKCLQREHYCLSKYYCWDFHTFFVYVLIW